VRREARHRTAQHDEIAEYARSGIDLLIVFPQIPRLDQVQQLAESVLPAYL
jgi:hypothetical protein